MDRLLPSTVAAVISAATPASEELSTLNQWVAWRREFVKERGEWTKVPYSPVTARKASSTDPTTWTSRERAEKYRDVAGLSGVGLVFAHDGDLTGIDLDHCRDPETGEIAEWASDIISALSSYTELSPSGTGLHILVHGSLPPGRRSMTRPGGGKVEMYDSGRYFTYTGQHLDGTPGAINERRKELADLHAWLFPSPEPSLHVNGTTASGTSAWPDHEVLLLARRAKNGDRFGALYDHGDTSLNNGDDSAADLALCDLLAFYAGPTGQGQVDRLFRDSALMRPKWDEQHGSRTYGEMTIDKAFSGRTEFYSGSSVRTLPERTNGHAGEPPGETVRVDGAAVLDAVEALLGRFIAYPSLHACVAHTLWIAHTHFMDAWETTPRLSFLSPEPASGKTRALEVTELLVPRPVEAVNVTPAYLFRKVADPGGRPTILFDEIDTVFGPKAKENEEIRGLLNAGHRVGAVAGRCVVKGRTVETEEIPAYCAVAMAGLGGLPDTILSRSIIVRMRRRAPGERIAAYRRRVHAPEGHAIRNLLAAWARGVVADVADLWPDIPTGIEDRDSDLWEPLLAVADTAGGDWPERARVAAVALVALSKAGTPSLGIRLLSDLREVFGDQEVMATSAILSALCGLDEAPWGEMVGGKPLNARGLAQRLRQYEVLSKTVRIGSTTPRGYTRGDLADAWQRYLSLPPLESATSATSATGDAAVPF